MLGTTPDYILTGLAPDAPRIPEPNQLDRIEALLADVVNRLARLEAATPTGAEDLEAELGSGGARRPPERRDDDTDEDGPEHQAEGQ